MYGAVIGDLTGSIYEYDEFLDSRKKTVNLDRRLSVYNKDLATPDCFYSDDSILTIAILDSILNGVSYERKLKEYAFLYKNYKPVDRFFNTAFSPTFLKWSEGNYIGTSSGNGAAMRVSPIGYLFDNERIILEEAKKATICSHNSIEAIAGAQAVALCIHYLKLGLEKNKVIEYISDRFHYNINMNLSLLQKTNTFTSDCKTSVELALFINYISYSFDEVILNSLSIGGDTDTIAAISGSIGEQIYPIKDEYINFANKKLPDEFVKFLKKVNTSN